MRRKTATKTFRSTHQKRRRSIFFLSPLKIQQIFFRMCISWCTARDLKTKDKYILFFSAIMSNTCLIPLYDDKLIYIKTIFIWSKSIIYMISFNVFSLHMCINILISVYFCTKNKMWITFVNIWFSGNFVVNLAIKRLFL